MTKELERLKRTLRMGYPLDVVWRPGHSATLAGEVRGTTIIVYDEDSEAARVTLIHEFLDYVISRVAEPYQRMTNHLIALLNDLAYHQKEELVEALRRWLPAVLAT